MRSPVHHLASACELSCRSRRCLSSSAYSNVHQRSSHPRHSMSVPSTPHNLTHSPAFLAHDAPQKLILGSWVQQPLYQQLIRYDCTSKSGLRRRVSRVVSSVLIIASNVLRAKRRCRQCPPTNCSTGITGLGRQYETAATNQNRREVGFRA